MHWKGKNLYSEEYDGDEAEPAMQCEHVFYVGTVVVVERSFQPDRRKHQWRRLDYAMHDLQRQLRTAAEETVDQHSWSRTYCCSGLDGTVKLGLLVRLQALQLGLPTNWLRMVLNGCALLKLMRLLIDSHANIWSRKIFSFYSIAYLTCQKSYA